MNLDNMNMLCNQFLTFSPFAISNLGPLMDLVKDGSKNVVQQSLPQIHGIQSQVQPQQQSSLRLPQQVLASTSFLCIINLANVWVSSMDINVDIFAIGAGMFLFSFFFLVKFSL